MLPLVLASTSIYRKQLLERLGLPFDCIAPINVDEEALNLPPEQLVMALARQKAESVAGTLGDAIVIGSDQVGVLDGQILTKPHTSEKAESQLMAMAGREHQLLTGVYVLNTKSGQFRQHLDCHRLTLRTLSAAEISDYVAREQPLDCAGSYKIEGLGISLMERIDGSDFTAIVGLPL
ncbi:MAG TPA: septum formation protein Maf, partial [Myxococcales bacterium]|nr:septum formation protein Maf [Myxococcales bacterium]